MLIALLLAAATRDPAAIPPPIRAMVDAAMASGDEAGVGAIVRYAKAADPASADAVAALAQEWRDARAQQRETMLRHAGAFDLWHGKIEAGGFVSTGNSPIAGVTVSAEALREGLEWRHKLHLQTDYQSSGGDTTREHYLAAYELNRKLNARAYIYGSAQFESDRFFGFTERYSASAGLGYGAIRRRGMTLDLELGPAFRATSFTDGRDETSPALRGNLDFDWKLGPGVSFSQDASAYLQDFNSTVSSVSAINARLWGPVAARFSYQVQYESMPPAGRMTTDTTTRASIVYSF